MKYSLVSIVLMFAMALTGCKEEVNFSAVEDDFGGAGVTPVDPVQPPEGQPPRVKIVRSPQDHKYDDETDVVFEVSKGDNDLDVVECFVDDVEINCDWEKGQVRLYDLPMGEHEFKVQAVDVKGLKDQADETWMILDKWVRKHERLKVDQQQAMTDILFVIDNSSSMHSEQKKISQRFDKFIEQVRGLDWHIGITTTDPRANEAWSDGRLHAFPNGDYFLTPDLGEEKAQNQFAKHVRRRESGWDTEEGIRATYRAIERSLKGRTHIDGILREFFRKDAALAVVVVSDENEAKNGTLNKGSNLIKLIRQNWGRKKVFQFNSIIVHTQKCLNGAGASWGYAYEDLSQKTNGVVGDICANNYSKILKDIGKGVADLQKVHKLKCVPQDRTGDGKVEMTISSKDGSPIPGYTIDGDTITFDRFLSADSYKFSYYCLAP